MNPFYSQATLLVFFERKDSPTTYDNVKYSYAIVAGICLRFLEDGILIISIFRLRYVYDDFNINKEFKLVCLISLITSFLSNFTVFLAKDSTFFLYLPSDLTQLKHVSCFIISVIIPVMQSYKSDILPFPQTKDCVASLKLALRTPIPVKYFSLFLSKNPKEQLYLTLYFDIKIFERDFSQTTDINELYNKATLIYNEYMAENSENKVVLGLQIEEEIGSKFLHLGSALDINLFDSVMAFIVHKLEEHFEKFKTTRLYKECVMQLERQENWYELLKIAEMIDN